MTQMLERMWRRILMVVGHGQSSTNVDDTGPIQIVQVSFPPDGHQIVDGIPIFQNYGFSSNPPPGTDFAVTAIGGDRSKAVAIGSNNKTLRYRNLRVGGTIMYDQQGNIVLLDDTGIKILAASQPIQITSPSQVNINAPLTLVTGDLKVTGNITDLETSNSVTVAQLRSAYDAHKHGGVTTGGGSTSTTDHPV